MQTVMPKETTAVGALFNPFEWACCLKCRIFDQRQVLYG